MKWKWLLMVIENITQKRNSHIQSYLVSVIICQHFRHKDIFVSFRNIHLLLIPLTYQNIMRHIRIYFYNLQNQLYISPSANPVNRIHQTQGMIYQQSISIIHSSCQFSAQIPLPPPSLYHPVQNVPSGYFFQCGRIYAYCFLIDPLHFPTADSTVFLLHRQKHRQFIPQLIDSMI